MEFVNSQSIDVDVDIAKENLEVIYDEDSNDKKFIDDYQQQESGLTFYRKFHNQPREIQDALDDRSEDNCELSIRDLEPEMYWEIDGDLLNLTRLKVMKKQCKTF